MENRRAGPALSLRHNGSHCSAGIIRADVELGPGAKRSRQPWTRTQVPGPEPWTGWGGGGLVRSEFCSRSRSVVLSPWKRLLLLTVDGGKEHGKAWVSRSTLPVL